MPSKRRAKDNPQNSASVAGGEGRAWLYPAALIVLLTLVAYTPAYFADSIWDDDQYLFENTLVQSAGGLPRIWLTTETPQYYPMVFTGFWLEHWLWRLNPAGYHVVNVLLHIASALLVWRVARRLRIPGAWCIGAVFAVHPVQVESVAWITERKNVLMGLFYLLALRAYLRFDQTDRWRHYFASAGWFVGALLSKTVAAMLPASLPFILLFRRRPLTLRRLLPLVPLLAVGAASGLFTAHLEREKVGAEGVEFRQSAEERALLIVPSAYLFYAEKVAWPHPLVFNYPQWDADADVWRLLTPAIVVLGAFGAALTLVPRFGWGPLAALLFAAINLFPALGFLNVFPHRYSYVADHFQYIGSLGFITLYVVVAVWLGRRLIPKSIRSQTGVALGVAVLVVFAGLTFQQSRSYETEQRLWEHTLAANPDSWIAMNNLGNQYRRKGRYREAVELFERAVRYPIARPNAYYSWAQAVRAQGRTDDALDYYGKAVQADPTYLEAAIDMCRELTEAGRLDQAAAVLERALEPEYNRNRFGMAWLNLAAVYERQQHLDDAVACLRRAVEIEPRVPEFRAALGKVLLRAGLPQEAVGHLRTALAAKPDDPELSYRLLEALIDSGRYAEARRVFESDYRASRVTPLHIERSAWLYATCPDDGVRDGPHAKRLADQLRAMVGGQLPAPLLATFAAVAAENGDFSTATRQIAAALSWARASQPELVPLYEEMQAAFRAGRAFRHQAK